jgi:hypothetical protein
MVGKRLMRMGQLDDIIAVVKRTRQLIRTIPPRDVELLTDLDHMLSDIRTSLRSGGRLLLRAELPTGDAKPVRAR